MNFWEQKQDAKAQLREQVAKAVGAGQVARVAVLEQRHEQTSHRIGRASAIVHDFAEICIAGLADVLAESRKQVAQRLQRQPMRAHHVRELEEQAGLGAFAALDSVQLAFVSIQRGDALGRRGIAFVREIVRRAREGVEDFHGMAQARRLIDRSRYYEEARRFSQLASEFGQRTPEKDFVVVTGGGPGIMEAANRGAHDAGAESIGLNIVLPFEQAPNRYITPALSFQFHYFAIRKMHFLLRAAALACFPGGFGTMDELFEVLTLVQTGKITPIPVILFGEQWWRRIIDFDAMVEEGVIAPEDVGIFRYVESAEEGWTAIRDFYR